MNHENKIEKAKALLRLFPDTERLPRDERKLKSIHEKLARKLGELGLKIEPITTHSVRGMTNEAINELALTLIDNQCQGMIITIRSFIVANSQD